MRVFTHADRHQRFLLCGDILTDNSAECTFRREQDLRNSLFRFLSGRRFLLPHGGRHDRRLSNHGFPADSGKIRLIYTIFARHNLPHPCKSAFRRIFILFHQFVEINRDESAPSLRAEKQIDRLR